ncbi:copper chaperone PCu(A)C [Mesobaculum littorinae]|uniref:Copper chaperone PCu(A)C n=1 Tax=Mesobaculum littorinae TaxID=2486419 RepID=A0A438AL69_9RHOB|nr:copper chaperone PCu(A)C [Mesobaculum littorinae]RVV99583.1 copper chaperone PCu(A)C [Mesobaculum littorinae]
MQRPALFFPSAIAATVLLAVPVAAQDMAVHDAWITEPAPMARALAAYMTLDNAGDAAVTVTGFDAPGFAGVDLHESREVDGVTTMAPVESLEVPAGGTVVLAPGGYHVMLMGPDEMPSLGDDVPLTLTLGDGTSLEVMADVRARPGRGGGGAMGHDAIDHGAMDHDHKDHGTVDHGAMDHGEGEHRTTE